MTDADKVMNPQHFERDPADIRIRMRMNPAIRIGISDHFWTLVEMLALANCLRSLSTVLLLQVHVFDTFISRYCRNCNEEMN